MFRKRAQRPAPSTLAASSSSVGIAWRPARKMMTFVPRPCQTDMATIDGIARVGSLSHFCGRDAEDAEELVEQPGIRGCRSTARRGRSRSSR